MTRGDLLTHVIGLAVKNKMRLRGKNICITLKGAYTQRIAPVEVIQPNDSLPLALACPLISKTVDAA